MGKSIKNRFDAIIVMVTRYPSDGLGTKADNKKITLKNAKKLLQDIASGRVDRDEAKKMYIESIYKEEQAVIESLRARNAKPTRKMIDIFLSRGEKFLSDLKYMVMQMMKQIMKQMIMNNQTLQICLI